MDAPTLPLPRDKLQFGGCSRLLCAEMRGGVMASEGVIALTFVRSWHQLSTLSCYMLRFGQDRNQFLRQPLESLNLRCIHVPVFYFPSLGEARSWEFLLIALGWAGPEGIWRVSAWHFPPGFDVAGFTLAWGAGASELFSRLITKGIDPCIVELVSPWGQEGMGVPLPPICTSCVYFFF